MFVKNASKRAIRGFICVLARPAEQRFAAIRRPISMQQSIFGRVNTRLSLLPNPASAGFGAMLMNKWLNTKQGASFIVKQIVHSIDF
ncbi:hypothetical protein SD10_22665 [Spirosoma radiotolerans]|uniref:Uncharacterized protein n=1 Tax=Spirosoma radiotolerans TaxID=1379870 RepID=A0A0E3V920_9BACT|nr:hypothetical protein SD10_22665 [Spirosoma radiotolerans]